MADWGDFVESSDEEEFFEQTESFDGYSNEPYYCPIRLGSVLMNRYRVEHKLGHGGFSTVWMAHDISKKMDVALKITTRAGHETNYESTMHNEICRRVQDTSRLLLSFNTFSLHGPHGTHQVLVLPLRGPSLNSCLAEIPIADRMSAAQQLLQALKSLHDANIVHRDLNDKNVLWNITSLEPHSLEEKYKDFGRPEKSRAAGNGEIVKAMKVPLKFVNAKSIYLADFGLAMNTGTKVNCKPQNPRTWCAPERFHNIEPSPASDMWSYICLFAKLYLGSLPWGDGMPSIVHGFGPFPQLWSGKFHNPLNYDKAKASWYGEGRQPGAFLERAIARSRPDVSSTERAHVLSFMRKGFECIPEDRITAGQLLQDASFRAVMRLYGV